MEILPWGFWKGFSALIRCKQGRNKTRVDSGHGCVRGSLLKLLAWVASQHADGAKVRKGEVIGLIDHVPKPPN